MTREYRHLQTFSARTIIQTKTSLKNSTELQVCCLAKKQILSIKEWLEPCNKVVGIFCKFRSQVQVVCFHEAL